MTYADGVMLEIQWTTVVTSLTVTMLVWLVRKISGFIKKIGDDMEADRKRNVEHDAATDAKLDSLARATQVNMRQNLIHTFEKYYKRGWVTPEERAAWVDTYSAYHGLGANGLIESYRRKLDDIEDREIGAANGVPTA